MIRSDIHTENKSKKKKYMYSAAYDVNGTIAEKNELFERKL